MYISLSAGGNVHIVLFTALRQRIPALKPTWTLWQRKLSPGPLNLVRENL